MALLFLDVLVEKSLSKFITSINRKAMQTNGYPEHIIKSFVAKKIKQFQALPKFGPQKCLVYLCLPLLSSVSIRFERQVKSAVKQCFSAVKPRVVCSTKELFSATKDLLPALQKSNVIYRF